MSNLDAFKGAAGNAEHTAEMDSPPFFVKEWDGSNPAFLLLGATLHGMFGRVIVSGGAVAEVDHGEAFPNVSEDPENLSKVTQSVCVIADDFWFAMPPDLARKFAATIRDKKVAHSLKECATVAEFYGA